jgi:hypothetical protein
LGTNSPYQMLQAAQNLKAAAGRPTGPGPAQDFNAPLRTPQQAQQATADMLYRAMQGNPKAKVLNPTTLEGMAEMLKKVQAVAPEPTTGSSYPKASPTGVPQAAIPPSMQQQAAPFPYNWRTLAGILRSIRP